jgi:hypothetical protein
MAQTADTGVFLRRIPSGRDAAGALMTADSTHKSPHEQQVPGWLPATNAVLAGCSIGAAAFWLWSVGVESIAIIIAILLVVTALAFMVARYALKRNWPGKWFFQIPGPAIVIFLLFGTISAAISALLAVAVVLFLRRKTNSPGNAA